MPSQGWVVQRAQAGGELRRREGEPWQKESSQAVRGAKGATHSAKANVASPRGGATGGTGSPVHPGCVCVARVQQNETKRARKKKNSEGEGV